MNDHLFAAVEAGDTDTVAALLDGGSDVDAYDSDGHTLLMRAVEARQIGIVRLLLDRGADAALRDREPGSDDHTTALFTAGFHPLRERRSASGYPDDPIYQTLIDYWKAWCKKSAPIPASQARRILSVYSDVDGHQAFRLKSGEAYEGYITVEAGSDTIIFNWAPGPFDPPGPWDPEDIRIPIADIDLDSLIW